MPLCIFVLAPAAFVVVNLLRHVDTPGASFWATLTITLHTAAPMLVWTEVVRTVQQYDLLPPGEDWDDSWLLSGAARGRGLFSFFIF